MRESGLSPVTNNGSPRRYYNENGVLVTPNKGPTVDNTPGPGAYSPSLALTRETPDRTVFGSSKQRERPGLTYISSIHSQESPPVFTPGPGTYRLPSPDKVSHKAVSASYKFGSAEQQCRTLPSVSPGPKYDGDSAPATIAPSYSFAPLNSTEMGQSRKRDEASKIFISQAHCMNDRGSAGDVPGPAAYDPTEVDVYKTRSARTPFGSSQRAVKDSMSNAQIQSDPSCGTSRITPGPNYDLPSCADPRGVRMGTAPRTYAPEHGTASAGPFISMGHLGPLLGTESPGAVYEVASTLGEQAAYSFPEAPTGRSSAPPAAVVPGPGAYRPLMEHSSKVMAMPVFSMGDRPPQIDRSADSPGPAAYNVAKSSTMESRRSSAPAYSLGARSSLLSRESSTPGPAAYQVSGPINPGPKRGFSFGGREKTLSNSFTSVRYHGPLAMQGACNSDSPGPQYDTSQAKTGPSGGTMKFGTAGRMNDKSYTDASHLPGPGSYNVAALNLSVVTSRFSTQPGTKFSKVDRFNNPAMSK